jgi:3-oxoadipate enol-lactonase
VSDDAGQVLRIGDLGLWVEDVGKGEPLLLISGLGYSNWCWQDLQAALSADLRVISFDNRGTGRSDKAPGPYSIAMLADDAARLLERLEATPAHVLGHSMGGYIALTLATSRPQAVRSLTLVSTTAGGPDMIPVPESTLKLWTDVAGLPPRESARRAMPTSFAPGWTEKNPQRFEALLEARLRHPTPPACWAAQFAACGQFLDRGIALAAIQCPALVIHGTADRVVPFANGERLARTLPNARLVALDGVGHLPPLEEPQRFAQLVREQVSA